MKLVSLEIKGFKSFAEKTTINFNDAVTGVVGPNGSGKSNVVDAIRWVLGEQKTTVLRSEKMENVIFNGTKNRKAAGLAEVFLTFENTKNLLPTEYHSVTISRHYYRNGESEYKLNNVTCRLKDITSLFMDTGISSDSYAIIELGMVNDILNDKEHSRRKLFEQAAGISKYKARKKETFQKLELTQIDLNRVDDLLFEIDSNLKSLESQARKTERYFKLKEEYKLLAIELAVFTIDGIRKAFEQVQQQQQQEEEKKIALDTEIVLKEAGIQQEKTDNIVKEKNLLQSQKQLNELVTGLKQKENEKNLLAENKKHQTDTKERLTQQNIFSGENLVRLEVELTDTETRKGNEQDLLTTLQQELDQAKVSLENIRLGHGDTRRSLDTQNRQVQAADSEINESDRKLAVNTVKKENSTKDIQEIWNQHKTRIDDKGRMTAELFELHQKETLQRDAVSQLTQKGDELQLQIGLLEEAVDKTRESLNDKNRKLDARSNEFNLTKSFIESMEGFPDSIKFLAQNNTWSQTKAPLLSDIISCNPEYRVAIETYLENYLNYYVVSDMKEAMGAVNLLSSASKGRANFFVLNDFEDFSSSTITAPEGTISAVGVLDLDNEYKKLGAYLLHNVFVAENDLQVEGTRNKNAVILSHSGKMMRSPYSVSGGQVGSFSGKRLGRVKNMEALGKEIEQLKTDSESLRTQLQTQQQELLTLKASSTDKQLDEARELLNQWKNQITSIKTKIDHLEESQLAADERKKVLEQLLHELDAEDELLNHHRQELVGKRAALFEVLTSMENEFKVSESGLNDSTTSFNQKNIQFLQQQNKLSGVAQEINFKQQTRTQLKEQIENNNIAIIHATAQLADIEQKMSIAEVELIHLYEEKTRQEATVAQVEQVYYESRGQINAEEEKIRVLHRSKEQVEMILNQVREKSTDMKIQLGSLKERLDIEFHLNIDELMDREPSADQNKEELTEKTARLRNRIENFGEINPMAVEAFNEMKIRADFIITQKTDLANAKEMLLKTIEEIDTTAKEQFLTAFNKVKENFQKVFRSLFTADDDCDLILVNPESPLDSDIDIIAKPKGKRPQTINQLSGGEKTLTAISLLFSLYLLKPAPFCILDEVDAPLDDANIHKFNDIIKEFSQDSQFILVTHNKQTMSTVDVIYGVTMQEQGVSKVVPVDFRSLN